MKRNLEERLSDTIRKLEKLEEEVKKTSGYSKETGLIRLLKEITKEQIQNENSHFTDNTAR